MPSYTGRDGQLDIKKRLWDNEQADAVQDGRIEALEGAGTQGPQGEVGPKGEVGAQGPKGDTGAIGPQGVSGSDGQDGANGLDGSKGDTGEQGPIGSTGPKGDAGSQGPKGDTGDIGPRGQDGETPHIERGKVTLDNTGQGTLNFAAPFTSEPIVVCSGVDDNGRAINVQIDKFFTQGASVTSVRVQADRIVELPGLLAGLFGYLVTRRDNLNGSIAHIIAIEP